MINVVNGVFTTMGVVLSVDEDNVKARVLTPMGIKAFSLTWLYRPLKLRYTRCCAPGELVEVVFNDDGALLSVREIEK